MAIAFITDVEAGSADTLGVTTAGVDTTGANLIVLATAHDGADTTPTDSEGNTWTAVAAANGTNPQLRMFYCYNPTTDVSHTFSLTPGGVDYPAIAMVAFSGAASSPLDQVAQNADVQPGSITPSEGNEVLVTTASHGTIGTAPTVDSPFDSNLKASIAGGPTTYAIGLAYEIQTSATARNPTWTLATSPRSSIASFKAAAAGETITVDKWYNQGPMTPPRKKRVIAY